MVEVVRASGPVIRTVDPSGRVIIRSRMDELIGLFFLIVALGCAAMIAFAIFVLAATVATVCAFGAAVHAFTVTMGRSIVHRGGSAAVSGPGEPSFRAYYRRQIWRDLGLSARAGWTKARYEMAKARHWVASSHTTAGWNPKMRMLAEWSLAAYTFVGLVIGAFLAAVIGLIPAVLVTLFATGAWAVGAPLRTFERLRRRRTGAHFDCSSCHDRFPLPVYECPSCGVHHTELAPGPFGVLRHRCICGARLPAVQFKGRERLPSRCPSGHDLGEGVGTVRTFHVPVAGGPSTGKSTFLAAALMELEDVAARKELATTVQRTSRDDYDVAINAMRAGVTPPKTSGVPPAMVAEVRGSAKSALLYAYDVAGEMYAEEDELRRDPAHGLAEGVILLVDPFALDRVRTDLEDEIDATPELGASAEAPQRMLERLIGVLEEKGVELRKVGASVCVTKTDALGVGDDIAAAPGADDHERTRAWLEQQGAGNFLCATEGAFGTVRFFGVSALGRMPGTGDGPFAPSGALEPLLWLLARAGVVPVAAGSAETTRSHAAASSAALDVTPKRPLFTGPLDGVRTLGSAAYFGIGLLAVGALAGASAPFAGSSTSSTSSTLVASDVEAKDGLLSGSEDEEEPPPGDDETDGTSTGPAGSPNSPARVLRRHFQRLSKGDYAGAFAMMSGDYRASNPNWTSERSAANPFINVTEIGDVKFEGGGIAMVPITFYGRDRSDTSASDTTCRRFVGTARMRKINGSWRYDPNGRRYEITELPSGLDVCDG